MICPSCKKEIYKVVVKQCQRLGIPLLETRFRGRLIFEISLRGVIKSLNREIKKGLIHLEIQCPLCHAILNNEIGLVK